MRSGLDSLEESGSRSVMRYVTGINEYTDRAITMRPRLPQIQPGAPIRQDLVREKVRSTTTMNSVRLGTGEVRSSSQLLLMKERHPLLAHEEEKATLA